MAATHPIGQHPTPLYTPSAACNRSYLLALLRAGVIAAVLIGVLALIVLT